MHIIRNKFKNLYVIILTLFLYNIAIYLWDRINYIDSRTLEKCTANIPFKIVMPFHINQQQKLIDNIKSWKQFEPCMENNINVELVFFYGHSLESFDNKEAFIHNISKHVDRFCFQKVHFVEYKYKNKEDDTHFKGARVMFEYLIYKQDDAFKSVDFVFLMEPDTYPIRSSWLNAVQNNIGDGNFWVKGTIFRGPDNLIADQKPNRYHLNGNSIYKISDENFINFYRKTREFVLKNLTPVKEFNLRGYDVDFYDYFFHKDFPSAHRSFVYKFTYTNMIQNYYGTKYSKQSVSIQNIDTYFIHGGFPSD